jgi:serine/threonine-protein kinase
MMGSPLYMSPEQMRSSRDVDVLTDIWALGVILFELMSGRPAFEGETVTELAIKVANEPTPAIRALRPEVPARLEAIIFKCTEKDPRLRYRNVGELARALLPFAPRRAKASVERVSRIIQAAGLSESGLEAARSLYPAKQGPLGSFPPVGRTTGGWTSPRSSMLGAVVIAAVVLFVGVGSLVLLRRAPVHRNDPPAAAARSESPAVSRPVPPVEPPKPDDENPAVIAPTPSASASATAKKKVLVGGPAPATMPAPAQAGHAFPSGYKNDIPY